MSDNSTKLISVLLTFSGAVAISSAWAGDIVLSLEEPTANSTYTGVANIRGWAVGSAGIQRVELYVDGTLKTSIPVGGRRSDVGSSYPTYPNSSDSGFSMAYNYSNLNAGQHSIRVRAVDSEGASKDASATFNATRFDNSYISNPSSINLNAATVSHDSQSIVINNIAADGKTYDIRLDWRTAIQNYAITQIVSTGGGGGSVSDFSGSWRYTGSLTSNTCSSFYPNPPSSYTSTLNITQSGTRLSGRDVGEGVSVSGSVDSQSNFSLTSAVLEEPVTSTCSVQIYNSYQGNFTGQTLTLAVNAKTMGSCPETINCAVIYRGTLNKTTNSTAGANQESLESDSGSPVEAVLQQLLNGLKK